MREVFDSKDIDAVLIATPDHWHAPAAIMACQAGKDVYVEKPHAHNMRESRLLLEASRKHNRIVQVGTQNRSCPYNHAAREYIASGKLGGVHLVKVFNLKPGKPFNMEALEARPQGLDWDKWLGPAPERPWHQNIYRSGWHHFWDFSGGDMADDGIHQLDLAMMVMGETSFPGKVACIGGRKAFRGDDSEVPDTQVVSYDFDRFIMTFELTEWPRYMEKTTGTIRRNDELPYWTQNSTRIELYGTERMMTLGRHGGGWQVTTSGGKVVDQMFGRPGDEPHAVNFLECVKTRKTPTADVAIAHKSISLVHTANIAHRIGNQTVQYDGATEKFLGNEAANALLGREYRAGYAI
jgi:predicted dehydrogenase